MVDLKVVHGSLTIGAYSSHPWYLEDVNYMTKGKAFTGIERKLLSILGRYSCFMRQIHKITKVRLKNHVRLRRLSVHHLMNI